MPWKSEKRLRLRDSSFVSAIHGLFLLLPFLFLLTSCRPDAPTCSPEDIRALNRWLDASRRGPADGLIEALDEGRSAAFLQDEVLRADSVELMEALTAIAHDHGVRTMGLFFLDASLQSEVDDFIGWAAGADAGGSEDGGPAGSDGASDDTAAEADEGGESTAQDGESTAQDGTDAGETAAEIGETAADADNPATAPESAPTSAEETATALLFASRASLGYAEYRDFLVGVKAFNEALPEDVEPMRLLALGDKGRVSGTAVSRALGFEDAESDPADRNTAEPVQPVFLWLEAGDAPLPTAGYAGTVGSDGSGDENESAEAAPASEDSSASRPLILSHYRPNGGALSCERLIEAVTARRDLRDRSFSYRPEEEPFAAWTGNSAGTGFPDADFVVVTAYDRRACRPIPDFVTEFNADAARFFFPDAGMENSPALAARRMNRTLRRQAREYAGMLEE